MKVMYGDESVNKTYINKGGKYKVVIIPATLIEKHNDIKRR